MTTELQAAAVELQQSEAKRAETTPDELEKALLSLELGTAWSSAAELDEDVKTIRAHIAAQSSEIEALKYKLLQFINESLELETDNLRMLEALVLIASYDCKSRVVCGSVVRKITLIAKTAIAQGAKNDNI